MLSTVHPISWLVMWGRRYKKKQMVVVRRQEERRAHTCFAQTFSVSLIYQVCMYVSHSSHTHTHTLRTHMGSIIMWCLSELPPHAVMRGRNNLFQGGRAGVDVAVVHRFKGMRITGQSLFPGLAYKEKWKRGRCKSTCIFYTWEYRHRKWTEVTYRRPCPCHCE